MSRARFAACAAVSTLALLTLSACGAVEGGSTKQASKESQSDIIKHITKGKIVSRSGDGGADDTTPVPVEDGPDGGADDTTPVPVGDGPEEGETVLVCTDANLQGLCSNLPVPSDNLVNSLFSANDMSSGATTSGTFNDNISYINNTTTHTICFFQNTGFAGKNLRVVPGEIVDDLNPDGKGNGLNDRISSFKEDC
ncbi:hypothetical protein ABZ608_41260 [Streptomyces sp. NPDC013172]|uniref:hypothetical protein n=1 Tax=Streptomyces sp. NPDC013172 TaxID=3155009 RepID=UPI0034100F9E